MFLMFKKSLFSHPKPIILSKIEYFFLFPLIFSIFGGSLSILLSVYYFPQLELSFSTQLRTLVVNGLTVFIAILQHEGIQTSSMDTLHHPGWVANTNNWDSIFAFDQLLGNVVDCSVGGCATQDFRVREQLRVLQN